MTTFATVTGTNFGTSRQPSLAPIVFVVDDDVSVCESLEILFQASGWDVETFASAHEFLDRPPASVPTCLILDVNVADVNALDFHKNLARDRPQMSVIFISRFGDVTMSVQAIKAGAIEFLTKPVVGDKVLAAVRDAIEISRHALEHAAKMRRLHDCYASLTPREREVMVLVASGLLNKQVGGELGISEITVKAHRGQVMRKMKADSLPALVHMVDHLGLSARHEA
jgi:FixJ family two-component response regulator